MSQISCLLLGSFNCESTITQQLESIQKSFGINKYCCLYFDDASNDQSNKKIENFFNENKINFKKVEVNKKLKISEKFYTLFKEALISTGSEWMLGWSFLKLYNLERLMVLLSQELIEFHY